MWRFDQINDGIMRELAERERQLLAEQAVRGLDSLNEVGLHPWIASGCESAGFGVHREVVFPGDQATGARRSARARCDLVLVEEPGVALVDPASEQAVLDASAGTLFAGMAHEIEVEGRRAEAGEACWIEVKAVAQHAYVDGIPGANRLYQSQLTKGPAADLVKLASDASIWFGGSLVVLFCEREEIARHDLAALAHHCLDQEIPIGEVVIDGFPIEDRAGNAWCGLGLIPIRA